MAWEVRGSYYEACNCDAVCPCRRHGERRGGESTYPTCDFVLSWVIDEGHVDFVDLTGLSAVMVGSYADDEPQSPWRVVLFVDDNADDEQHAGIADVLLGRLGGDTHRMYASGIVEVSMVRSATTELVHEPGRWRIGVESFVEVRSTFEAPTDRPVSCGISGHLPGTELIADSFVVAAPPYRWNLRERCAFTSPFRYRGG